MSNPDPQTIPQWQWVNVASNVITGNITRLNTNVSYYQTYRDLTDDPTAPPVPTKGTLPDEAIQIFEQTAQESIGHSNPIDVYIMCKNDNSKSNPTGKIRVDV